MIKGKTKTGFNFKIDEETLNDYELLELFADVDDNPLLVPKVVEKLLGEVQKNKLIEHVRDDKGIARADKIAIEIEDMLLSAKETKN